MSILIKGMEMPTKKAIAGVIHADGFACSAEFSAGVCTEYLKDCEAVPVPPHGRLGDLDALYEKFARLESEAMSALKTTNTGSTDWIKWSAILTERTGYKFDIADAPTIIPAEEGE